jgi:hypothetical protein
MEEPDGAPTAGAVRQSAWWHGDTVPEREDNNMSWISRLQDAQAAAPAPNVDAYRLPLERLRGQIGDDGLERVSTQTVLDVLGILQHRRRVGTYKRVCKLMVELGWTPVRVRGLSRGAYLEQVRGYARDARHRATVSDQDRGAPSQNAAMRECSQTGGCHELST